MLFNILVTEEFAAIVKVYGVNNARRTLLLYVLFRRSRWVHRKLMCVAS
jgi:hypothetical protein